MGHHQGAALGDQPDGATGVQPQGPGTIAGIAELDLGLARGHAGALNQQLSLLVATQIGKQQGLARQAIERARSGLGQPLARLYQVALLQRHPPDLHAPLAIGGGQHHSRAIGQHLQAGNRGPDWAERLPTAVMLLQLELVTSPHRHDRHDPGTGIPTPKLGDHGHLALIAARHHEADGPVQRARRAEQQSQGMAVAQPAVG